MAIQEHAGSAYDRATKYAQKKEIFTEGAYSGFTWANDRAGSGSYRPEAG